MFISVLSYMETARQKKEIKYYLIYELCSFILEIETCIIFFLKI